MTSAVSPIEEALLELRNAERQQDSAVAMKVIADALGALTEDDRRKLLQNPAVSKLIDAAEQKAAESMRPGSIVCGPDGKVISKVPWTGQHMKETLPMVTWTPMQNRDVTVNGVTVRCQKGVPVTTPDVFKAVAEEAWLAEENKLERDRAILKNNFGDNSILLYGDGTPA